MLKSNFVKNKIFLEMCKTLSGLSNCPRGNVGAIILYRYGKSVSFGFNGAPSGMNHCEDVGCTLIDGHCSTAVHAEINATLNGDTQRMKDGTMYLFGAYPCYRCAQAIVTVGITYLLVADNERRMSTDQERGWDMLGQTGIKIEVDDG